MSDCQAIEAMRPVLASFGAAAPPVQDFAEVMQSGTEELASATDALTKGAVIVQENVLCFCFKAVLADKGFAAGEIAKRKSLLTSHMNQIQSGKHGMSEGLIQPVLMKTAKEIEAKPQSHQDLSCAEAQSQCDAMIGVPIHFFKLSCGFFGPMQCQALF